MNISIHTALAGCDHYVIYQSIKAAISIHTALAGCDGYLEKGESWLTYFNPHSPRRL